jgi:uncharacterized protein
MGFFEKAKHCSTFFSKETVWGCRAGLWTVAISTQGNIFSCSRLLGLSCFDEIMGRLGDIHQGIVDKDARRVWIDHTDEHREKCKKCEVRDYCTGGCPAESYLTYGTAFEPTEDICRIIRSDAKVLRKLEKEVPFFMGYEGTDVSTSPEVKIGGVERQ